MSMPMHVGFEGRQAARAEQVSDEIQGNIQAHAYSLESSSPATDSFHGCRATSAQQHADQLAADLDGHEMRLPLSLDETLLGQALALQACLAVGSRLHPRRDNKFSH